MDADRLELLQELLCTYGPGGEETAVRDICRRELTRCVDETWVDAAGNLVGLLHGFERGPDAGPIVQVMAHLDELSMIIKRIDEDGNLHVQPLGMMYPGNFGLGPVAVLGDQETLTAVLALGSEHTTQESMRIWETKPDQGDRSLDWNHVYVFTGRSPAELADAGVAIGNRVCVHRSKRGLVDIGEYCGSYFLDDRAALAIMLDAARRLADESNRPRQDVYFVCTTSEELGGIGASYASAALPGEVTLALDVAPTEAEYQTRATAAPIIAYSDTAVVYDKTIADTLVRLAAENGIPTQRAVLGSYESDASNAKSKGQAPRSALLGLPILSTHGYEVMHRGALDNCVALLTAFLRAD